MDDMTMISETSDLQLEVTQAKPCLLNSAGSGLAGAFSPVHPRACGEQLRQTLPRRFRNGSSPRVRGTDDRRLFAPAQGRFIPARAGNRCCAASAPVANTVHPRACGEQAWGGAARHYRPGSSPRVRGTVLAEIEDLRLQRFIPARAGNSPPGAPISG